jgi:Flp pilus assembly protein TadG
MAMVEMVIVLPLLLMVLFGIMEFGVLFGRWQTVTNAAREGARTAVVFRTDCDEDAVRTEVRDVVRGYAAGIGITLNDADITVTGVCGAKNTSSTVNVSTPYTFSILPGFAPSVNPTIDLVGNSVMRNEGSG